MGSRTRNDQVTQFSPFASFLLLECNRVVLTAILCEWKFCRYYRSVVFNLLDLFSLFLFSLFLRVNWASVTSTECMRVRLGQHSSKIMPNRKHLRDWEIENIWDWTLAKERTWLSFTDFESWLCWLGLRKFASTGAFMSGIVNRVIGINSCFFVFLSCHLWSIGSFGDQ